MSDCPTCVQLECSGLQDDALYSLESENFPFIDFCPKGYTCTLDSLHMVCCGLDLFVLFPPGITSEQRRSITGSLVAECSRRRQFCGELNPPSGCEGDNPPPECTGFGDPPIQRLYYNEPAWCEVPCPDGNKFRYTVRAGQFLMPTLQQANYVAFQYACRQAKDHQICLSDLPTTAVCADVAYSQTIKATGKYLAVNPGADFWAVSAGTLPPGLTFNGGFIAATAGHKVTITGTPTTAGVYTFTVRVTAYTIGSPGFGDYMEKQFTITVIGISPSTLPDGTIGTAYLQNPSVGPTHDQETEVWTLTSGTLPAGLTLTSAGVLSGTPTGLGASYNLTFQVQFTLDGKDVTCSRQYTLTMNDAVTVPTPIEYWKMEENNTSRIGQVQGVNLIQEFGVNIPNAAGKIGMAARFVGLAGFPYPFLDNSPFNEPKLKNLGTGFSICGWIKIATAGVGSTFFDITFYDSFSNAVGEVILEFLNSAKVQFTGSDASSNSFAVNGVARPQLVVGTFAFFRMWYDPTDGKIRLSINNGTHYESDLGGLSFPASFGAYIVISNNNGFGTEYLIDEVGLFMPFLTDAQASLLYNAGAGETCCPFP